MTLIRRILPLLLLLVLCLGTVVACSPTANAAKYDKTVAKEAVADLRDYVREQKGVGKSLILLQENETVQVFTYLQKADVTGVPAGEEPLYVSVITFSADGRYSYRLDLVFDKDDPENVLRRFKYSDRTLGRNLLIAEDTLSIPYYTGKDLMSFDKVEYPEPGTTADGSAPETSGPIPEDKHLKETARDMLNLAVITLDAYGEKTISHGREDFGFLSYNEKYDPENIILTAYLPDYTDAAYATLSADGSILPAVAFLTADGLPEAETAAESVAETEDPLGPAFSGARISYALRMTLMGLGMVFAVLALLWAVLAIFKLVFVGKEPKAPKAPKKKPEPAPAPAPVAPIPVGTDPAVVAAITAAIAEMIASDPALAEQYAGGFRVVEFKRKSGKTSWNH